MIFISEKYILLRLLNLFFICCRLLLVLSLGLKSVFGLCWIGEDKGWNEPKKAKSLHSKISCFAINGRLSY